MNSSFSCSRETSIKNQAKALGFDLCGITSADPSAHAAYFEQWIHENKHGEMAWLARDPSRRTDPRKVLENACSLLIVGLNYYQEKPSCRGRIATYALGEDYHEIMEAKLQTLMENLHHLYGGHYKRYVDTGPLLEKPLAHRAGVGWQSKSTMIIHEDLGPWLFLGEILTTLPLKPDSPAIDRCGTCTRCLTACPTGAITAPYQLDARRCISYLTIELKGSIPEELRPLIGDRIYGCDECLEVCPWNRFAQQAHEEKLVSPPPQPWDLHELLRLTPQAFNRRFKKSPIRRTKRRGLLRNVCVALGNIGTKEDLPALYHALQDTEPLIREHATWAIEQIKKRLAPSISEPQS